MNNRDWGLQNRNKKNKNKPPMPLVIMQPYFMPHIGCRQLMIAPCSSIPFRQPGQRF